MRISPHLCFNGTCREAMEKYQKILGGSLQTMLTYGESPLAASIDPQLHGRIVHAALKLGDLELTGVDVMPDSYRAPQGFFVTLFIPDEAKAKLIFDELGAGGTVQMPFQATFWSPGFGVLIDRFGVPWEISSGAEPGTP